MSEDSIDLIQKMLDRDLSTRPTMSQVLAHPVLSIGAYLMFSGFTMSSNWIGTGFVKI